MIGTVKWFTEVKGFVTPDGATDRAQDVFLHIKELKRSKPPLREVAPGDILQFDTADPLPGKPHRRATNITLIRSAPRHSSQSDGGPSLTPNP